MANDASLNATLWILQLLLAMTFLIHGRLMISPPQPMPERMAERLGYVLELPPGFRRFIGLAELVAPVGLILPGAIGIFPWLTPLAAAGLAIVMASAIVFHVRRREFPNLILNGVLLSISIFVAYERWFALPL